MCRPPKGQQGHPPIWWDAYGFPFTDTSGLPNYFSPASTWPFHSQPSGHYVFQNQHSNYSDYVPPQASYAPNQRQEHTQSKSTECIESSETLPDTRERRLAVGLQENEGSLQYKLDPCGSYMGSAILKLSIWTGSYLLAPPSRTRNPISIFPDHPLESQLRSVKNRVLYQIAGVILRAYRAGGSPHSINSTIQAKIMRLHQSCIVCGTDLGTKDLLYRSTTCSAKCSIKFRGSSLEVRVTGLENWCNFQANKGVLKVLWCAAMMAVHGGHLQPPPTLTVNDVYTAVNTTITGFDFPNGTLLDNHDVALSKAVEGIKKDPKAERFVAWSGTHYRGCLIASPAIDQAQFYLYNANPAIEKAYERNRISYGNCTSIVFHGTTFDRLYPIMCDGLRYDDHLKQTGRAFGNGIYATDDSTVALRYAKTLPCPLWMKGHSRTPFGMHVLLVCELTGGPLFVATTQDTRTSAKCNIYVVNDPSMMIVRGILIGTNGTDAPALSHETLKRAIRR